jgi:chemotaxis protein CheX
VGQVVYGLSLVTATKIAAAMSSIPVMTFDDFASSSVAELGNMISGHATTLLADAGYDCQITPPTIIRGANIEICTATPALVVPLHTDFGKIEINVALKEAAAPIQVHTVSPSEADPAADPA